MKKYLLLTLVFVFIANLIISCSSSSNSDDTIKIGQIHATLDGNPWKGQNGLATNMSFPQVQINAAKTINNNKGTETITLIIGDVNQLEGNCYGKFTRTEDILNSQTTTAHFINNTTASYTITLIDETHIEGTFEFEAMEEGNPNNKVTIIDGEFKLKFQD